MNIKDFENYNVKNLKFKDLKKRKFCKFSLYAIEEDFSDEEKIQIIDSLNGGIASYMIDILKKYQEEKDSLPQTEYNNPKTVSLKAWIKRNDKRRVIDVDFKYGEFYMFGESFLLQDGINTGKTEYGYNKEYSGEFIVKQWFHNFLEKLTLKEISFYRKNSPFIKRIKELKEYINKYDVLNDKLYNLLFDYSNINDLEKVLTSKEVDYLINKYSEIEKFKDNKLKEIEEYLEKEDKFIK